MNIRRANANDNEAICQLMEAVSIDSDIDLLFERRPDYFLGAALQAEKVEVYVLADGDHIAGVFSVGIRQVYLDGKPRPIRYLCDLRLHPDQRSGIQLARGFRYIKNHILTEGEFMQTLILKENVLATSILTSERACLPIYQNHGSYLTHFIPKQKTAPFSQENIMIRKAALNDIPMMDAFYHGVAASQAFSPVIDFSQISSGKSAHYSGLQTEDFLLAEQDENIVGICALWDQSHIRRIRVRAYNSTTTKWGRPLINLFSKIKLPPPLETIRTTYLYAFTFSDPSIGKMLLNAAISQLPNQQLLVLGLDSRDPKNLLLEKIKNRTEEGVHYLVGYHHIPQPDGIFTFEAARI
ncbi:MAG: hypothetical protein ACPG32_05680 [Akkermansiaceae bacterium]